MDGKQKYNQKRNVIRAERKAKGLCVECGKPSNGFRCCEICREYIKNLSKLRKQRRKCKNCGGKIEESSDKWRCNKCLEKANIAEKNRVEELKAKGLCRCNREIKSDKIMCQLCLDKFKKEYNERINNNLCTSCGKNKPKEKSKRCEICIERSKNIRKQIIEHYGNKCACC